MVEEPQPNGRIKDIRVYRDSFIGMCVLACVPFLIFGALPAYGWALALGMFVFWTFLVAQGCRWFVPHPRRVLVISGVSLLTWTAVVLITR